MTADCFLLDTNVLSATSPDRREIETPEREAARAWLRANEARCWLPAIAIGEAALGVGYLEAAGASRRAADLAAWLDRAMAEQAGRILALDDASALAMREIAAAGRAAGIAPDFPDLAIAAIARRHGLTVATRNLRHFAPLGVPVVDPFAIPA